MFRKARIRSHVFEKLFLFKIRFVFLQKSSYIGLFCLKKIHIHYSYMMKKNLHSCSIVRLSPGGKGGGAICFSGHLSFFWTAPLRGRTQSLNRMKEKNQSLFLFLSEINQHLVHKIKITHKNEEKILRKPADLNFL